MDRPDPPRRIRRVERPADPYGWSRPLSEVLDDIAPPPAQRRKEPRADPSSRAKSIAGFSLSEQIDCVTREVALREHSYPKQIAAGRLTQAEAARKIARMRAVLDTLVNLQRMIDSVPRQGRSKVAP